MNKQLSPIILVIGGTGTQGGNVARELLKYKHRVRVLTRDPASSAAKAIEQLGAEVVQGDLGDFNTLLPAMKDVSAIFSAQYTDPNDLSLELRNASNMVNAARDAGVRQVIHTSVVGTNLFPRWDKSQILTQMWEHKYKVEELIRHGGFEYWTILHPSWFMENLMEPLASYMAPELKYGKLFGLLRSDTPMKLSCGEDMARFARLGFESPKPLHAKDINIASDELSMQQIADQLGKALARDVVYEQVTHEEAVRRGLFEGTAQSHLWMNDIPGWGFDLNETKAFDIKLKSFEQWLTDNRNRIAIE